ncbi:DeoR/GlpR family DNA-binding transcription regulator [Mycetocola zhadangensis]|uniref:DeoR/GlpR transcriptional regulator n=1 Tax=Mycetocola zhadangensis TaxID=1164595 RepID=A0A3L7J3A4_9MICO|nr:DeoR/GlpR family DNA-binding transcription regulator [Mycetocola zhadangensis]RLQ83901.1 DeoR/GlpR transcriptional regulator [Mycetocola zhadangensis]GGE97894.1 DeoR family transcriptional regulator [Mycetocola zhadangensis]
MATTSTVDAESRRERLLEILTTDGIIRLDAAAERLGVSAMTVRRDLADLETEGQLRRVRGGAVPSLRPRSFVDRMSTGADAKLVIADKALDLMPTTGAVAFDASSTAGTVLARMEGTRDELTLATNSYENFQSARRVAGTALLIGGEAEERTDSFVGLLACQAAGSLHYSRFFTSAGAVDAERGTSEVTLAETQVKLAFVDASDETVLLVDSSKLGQRALARALNWQHVSLMITELDPTDSRLDPYRELVALA